MRNTRQGSISPNGGESLTLQQVMETMQALQEEVAVSRANQERIQADLVALRATNEELHRSNEELCRDMQTQVGEREEGGAVPRTWNVVNFKFYFSQAIRLYIVFGDALFPL